MTEAVVAKSFPYWDNGTIIKFKAGESFDFPARSYRSLRKAGYLVDDAIVIGKPTPADADEVKKPRGRKPKAERFLLDDDSDMVPELGE